MTVPERDKPIGPLITELRNGAGWSQAELAERLNRHTGKYLTRWDISRWETGRRIPVTDLPALANVLRVSLTTLEQAAERARTARLGAGSPPAAPAPECVFEKLISVGVAA